MAIFITFNKRSSSKKYGLILTVQKSYCGSEI